MNNCFALDIVFNYCTGKYRTKDQKANSCDYFARRMFEWRHIRYFWNGIFILKSVVSKLFTNFWIPLLKSISFKKGAKNSCVHEICRLLPRSKSSTNHNKTSPNPNLRKYTVKGFVMYIFLSNSFTWFHRNLWIINIFLSNTVCK